MTVINSCRSLKVELASDSVQIRWQRPFAVLILKDYARVFREVVGNGPRFRPKRVVAQKRSGSELVESSNQPEVADGNPVGFQEISIPMTRLRLLDRQYTVVAQHCHACDQV